VVKVSERRHGLGSEHPLCDKIQLNDNLVFGCVGNRFFKFLHL